MPRAAEIRSAWEALPWVDVSSLPLGRRPLILAPHPDDESLGCGGLIAAYCSAGLPPVVAVLTDGAASHPNLDAPARTQLRRQRQQEVRQAVACLGLPASNLELLGLPDGALAQAAGPCVAVLTHLARTRGCNIIVVTSPHDQHPDHQAAALIAREVAASACIPCVSYPTWAWVVAPDTDFPVEAIRGWRLDITRYLPAKRRAIVAHSSQYFGLPDDPWQACLPAELLAIAQRPYEVILTS